MKTIVKWNTVNPMELDGREPVICQIEGCVQWQALWGMRGKEWHGVEANSKQECITAWNSFVERMKK